MRPEAALTYSGSVENSGIARDVQAFVTSFVHNSTVR